MPPAVRRIGDPEHPWLAIDAQGLAIGCETLPLARATAGLPALAPVPDPVPATWFRDYLAATGLSAPAVAKLLRMPDDRRARDWKAGKAIPNWATAALLVAWANGSPPDLE